MEVRIELFLGNKDPVGMVTGIRKFTFHPKTPL